MSSFFGKAVNRYQPIPEDGKINTDAFLKACSEIVPFFGNYLRIEIPFYYPLRELH